MPDIEPDDIEVSAAAEPTIADAATQIRTIVCHLRMEASSYSALTEGSSGRLLRPFYGFLHAARASRLNEIQVLKGYHAVRRRNETADRPPKDDRRTRVCDRHCRCVVAQNTQRPAV